MEKCNKKLDREIYTGGGPRSVSMVSMEYEYPK